MNSGGWLHQGNGCARRLVVIDLQLFVCATLLARLWYHLRGTGARRRRGLFPPHFEKSGTPSCPDTGSAPAPATNVGAPVRVTTGEMYFTRSIAVGALGFQSHLQHCPGIYRTLPGCGTGEAASRARPWLEL
jgi:hypothetical protein